MREQRACRREHGAAGRGTPLACPGDAPVVLSAAGWYRGVYGHLIRCYKKEIEPGLDAMLEARVAALYPAGGDHADPLLVPVPMAGVRRRERGQNPAERLAAGLARVHDLPLAARALERSRYRRPLRGLSAGARRAEMANAVEPGPEARMLAGRRCILVDDVVTTGSTLSACARAIQRAGGEPVLALALARAPRRRRRAQRDPAFAGPEGVC